MTDVRLSLPTVFALVAIASAAAFAAGRSTSSSAAWSSTASPSPVTPLAAVESSGLPPGHPPTGAGGTPNMDELPAGHPPLDGPQAEAHEPSSVTWKAPARWQSLPNASSMRLATYRVPRAEGDKDDAELSIMQAGGSVDANIERWTGQFDAAGQKTAKRSTKKIGQFDVTILEIQGQYSGGMGKDPTPASGWALLGAIVATPGMPHFFKLTGPAKTVLAARSELHEMLATLAPSPPATRAP